MRSQLGFFGDWSDMPHDKVFTFGVDILSRYRVQISNRDPSHGHSAKYESINAYVVR